VKWPLSLKGSVIHCGGAKAWSTESRPDITMKKQVHFARKNERKIIVGVKKEWDICQVVQEM